MFNAIVLIQFFFDDMAFFRFLNQILKLKAPNQSQNPGESLDT